VPVIRVVSDKRDLSLLKWGLVPAWSKTPVVKFSNINARAETIATSRAYRPAFENRRCLMPADGFFEWAPGPPKQPHYFRLSNPGLFAFAAIWEH
jgi:putative SOS response-associated peptidase YedK